LFTCQEAGVLQIWLEEVLNLTKKQSQTQATYRLQSFFLWGLWRLEAGAAP
jgi:hypothetical protein